MATKPTVLPRWATTVVVVEPPAGKKDVGWVKGEEPPAEFENWRAENVYDWLLYLDDGDLQGDHTFDGNVTVRDEVRLEQDAGGNYMGLKAPATVTGNAVFELPDGFAAANDSLLLTSTAGVMTHTRDPSMDSVTTAEEGIRHADVEREVPLTIARNHGPDAAASGWEASGAGAVMFLRTNGTAGATEITFRLPLARGERLKEIRAHVVDNDGGSNISMLVFRRDVSSGAAPAAPVTLGSLQLSAGATANVQVLAVTGLTETVVADTVYGVLITGSAAGVTTQEIHMLTVVVDRIT